MTNMTVQRRTASSLLYGSSYNSTSSNYGYNNSNSNNASNNPNGSSSSQQDGSSNSNNSNNNMIGQSHKIPDYLSVTPIVEPLMTIDNHNNNNHHHHSHGSSSSSTNISSNHNNKNNKSNTSSTNINSNSIFASKYQVPLNWNDKDKCSLMALTRSNLRVTYQGSGKSDSEAAAVRAICPIPVQCGIFYYEVEIINKGRDGYIAIGFCSQSVSLNRLPGWELNSWGYHGDDGNSFSCSGTGKPYGPTFTTGDIIGCCINLLNQTAFYTKNGVSLGIAFKDVRGSLFPAVGLRTPGEVVEANFGSKKFRFDIELYVQDEKERLLSDLKQIPLTIKPSSKPDSLDLTALIQEYFEHEGFAESAKAMKKYLNIGESNEISSSYPSSSATEEVSKRKHVQQLIFDHKIDEVIVLMNHHYPNLLATNEELLFCLETRKWIELVRNCFAAPLNNIANEVEENKNHNDMEVDDVVTDTRDDVLQNWQPVIEYGRYLFKTYSHDVIKLNNLKEYSIILAYRQINNPSLKRLFQKEKLEHDAALVNAAILEYQGHSKNTLIERLIQQCVAAREAMVEEGMSEAAVLNPIREFL